MPILLSYKKYQKGKAVFKSWGKSQTNVAVYSVDDILHREELLRVSLKHGVVICEDTKGSPVGFYCPNTLPLLRQQTASQVYGVMGWNVYPSNSDVEVLTSRISEGDLI